MSTPDHYYIYRCSCKNVWGTARGGGRRQECYKCHRFRGPTKTLPWRPKRMFGEFECDDCGNEWSSGNTWLGMGQICQECDVMVYPYEQRPLRRRTARGREKPHRQELCEMCEELGRNCRGARQKDIEEVLLRSC